MYQFVTEIYNDQGNSTIPDVAFHPDGRTFVVSYRENNQICIYESSTLSLLRTYQNPEAKLDWPLGLVVTNRHIIVSNKIDSKRKPGPPSFFNVYRIGDSSGEPITVFNTPPQYSGLGEAHSLDVHNGRLLATYSGKKNVWAIVSYSFDDETGIIYGPTSILKSWFESHGTPKGLCFNKEGTKIIVTIMGLSKHTNIINRFFRRKVIYRPIKIVINFIEVMLSKVKGQVVNKSQKNIVSDTDNSGIIIFDVDENGLLAEEPVQTFTGSQFSRPENVNLVGDLCSVSNTTSNTVNLYKYSGDYFPHAPWQTIKDHLSFPHDACLSPDKKMLVVANYGFGVVNGKVQWGKYLKPRSDKLTVFELHD